MFTTSNFRFLRINKTTTISLNLVLAKEDLAWFNDYSFQEVLAVLKPLLVARIDMYNQGHLTRLPTTTSTNDPNNGLDDVGVVLGGDHNNGTPDEGSSTRTGRGVLRRQQSIKRPRFSIWYGFRDSTLAERGSAILLSNKKLGFHSKVKEEVKDDNLPIREEEDDTLRVSDFPQSAGNNETEQHTSNASDDGDEYHNAPAGNTSKRSRRQSTATPKGKGRKSSQSGKHQDVTSSVTETDHKPSLNISYSPLKLLPHTLHISIRALGSSYTGERITGGDPLDDEQSLFPPNLDFS
ncbi:hypothetical protein BG004_004342 [Podila humilis]|nr:hypothetical protein BG004_004342 [Podila humilis]